MCFKHILIAYQNSIESFWKACTCMSDLRESINIGPTSRSFQSPEKEKKKRKYMRENTQNMFSEKQTMLKLFCRNVFNEIFARIEANPHQRANCLLHKNCGKTAPTRATTNKLKAALDELPTAIRSFAENSKQNHRNSPIFRLTLRLFRAGKQRAGTRLRI